MNLDYQIFRFINNLVGKNNFLDFLGVIGASYLIALMFLALLCLGFIYKDKKDKINQRLIILKTFLGGLILIFINYLIGFIYFRPRPFVDHEVNKLIERSSLEKSFPSDHTGLAFIIAFSIYFYNKKLGILLLIFASLVGLSRVYVGVHYPLDIIGGFLIAWLISSGINFFERKKIKWLDKGKGNFFIFRFKK